MFSTTYSKSAWSVWSGSITGPGQFVARSRKEIAGWWHRFRRWFRGRLTHLDWKIFYVLAFDFFNYETGRCDPSHRAIARKAACHVRSVANSLRRLKAAGMLTWQRRCRRVRDEDGRVHLRQRSNAYVLLAPSEWVGYRDDGMPLPTPDTLGCPAPVLDPIEAAVAEVRAGNLAGTIAALETGDELARALAGFGRAITGLQGVQRNTTLESDSLPPPDDHEGRKAYWTTKLRDG